MKRVKVLRPFGSYAVGDTPVLLGAVARDRRERGDVKWLDDVPAASMADEPADDAPPAKPRTKRAGK